MAATRRGQPPLSVQLPPAAPQGRAGLLLPDLPPISALFLIDFDVKAGYTIVWKRALPGLELEGVVEYKSLPSGLHTVAEDLIYFVHDAGHAGLSAFVNWRTEDEASRHARMIAVGVLVPLSYGRLGRAWRHADGLKDLAARLVQDKKKTQLLEEYWNKNKAGETTAPQPLKDTPLSSPTVSFKSSQRPSSGKGHTRNRSASDGAALLPPGQSSLSPYHPAWSLTRLLETFGPLIFPIHRAALLRKRILISTNAPVLEACNFVYDISILSNIPLSVVDVLDPTASVQRLQPLFTVGIHDIPSLVEQQQGAAASGKPNGHGIDNNDDDAAIADDLDAGWIACTTDSILSMKDGLWDMLITLPPAHAANAKERVWPTVESPKGVPVRATQRDLRRLRSLKSGLAQLLEAPAASPTGASDVTGGGGAPSTPGAASGRRSSSSARTAATSFVRPVDHERSRLAHETEPIVEPVSWAALAYSGFMWWASAGEQRRAEESEEHVRDATLLANLAPPSMTMGSQAQGRQRRSSSTILTSGGLGSVAPAGGAGGLADSVSSLTARRADGEGGGGAEEDGQARTELAIIAYFHRLTTQILSVLADVVESSDEDDFIPDIMDPSSTGAVAAGAAASDNDEDDSGAEDARLLRAGSGSGADIDDGPPFVRVGSDVLEAMGLDVWSKADAEFVQDVTLRYFDRRAYVETKGVEVCGLRVC